MGPTFAPQLDDADFVRITSPGRGIVALAAADPASGTALHEAIGYADLDGSADPVPGRIASRHEPRGIGRELGRTSGSSHAGSRGPRCCAPAALPAFRAQRRSGRAAAESHAEPPAFGKLRPRCVISLVMLA